MSLTCASFDSSSWSASCEGKSMITLHIYILTICGIIRFSPLPTDHLSLKYGQSKKRIENEQTVCGYFNHISRMVCELAILVCFSVHQFGLKWNIFATIRWIALTFTVSRGWILWWSQDSSSNTICYLVQTFMFSPGTCDNFGDPLVCMLTSFISKHHCA